MWNNQVLKIQSGPWQYVKMCEKIAKISISKKKRFNFKTFRNIWFITWNDNFKLSTSVVYRKKNSCFFIWLRNKSSKIELAVHLGHRLCGEKIHLFLLSTLYPMPQKSIVFKILYFFKSRRWLWKKASDCKPAPHRLQVLLT